uniref:Uncharacterized protein n=1 Tax=Rhizophora mucronata TaxID=61149 RepID=A0A2P2QP00_RHIMU
MDFSDSGSSEELLMPSRRSLGPETIRACNGLSGFDEHGLEESDVGRKRIKGEDLRRNEVVGVMATPKNKALPPSESPNTTLYPTHPEISRLFSLYISLSLSY